MPLLLLAVGVADAGKGKSKGKQVRFVSGHPIPKAEGSGFCHIDAPHVHAYAPAEVKLQYRVHDGDYVFVGDPVAYGWEGERYAYYGHHPIAIDVVLGDEGDDVEHCYLDGAHYHAHAPPASLEFELKADAYWYVGDPAPAYLEARAVLDPIDVVYEPIVYTRPAVVVASAPVGWIGVVVVAPAVDVEVVAPKPKKPKQVRGHAHIGVGFEVVVPSVSIEIGVGGRHHHHHGHKHKHKKHKRHKKHRHHDHDDD